MEGLDYSHKVKAGEAVPSWFHVTEALVVVAEIADFAAWAVLEEEVAADIVVAAAARHWVEEESHDWEEVVAAAGTVV